MRVIITQIVEVHDPDAITQYAKQHAEQWGMTPEEMDDIGTAVRESVVLHHPDPCPLEVGIELTQCDVRVEE